MRGCSCRGTAGFAHVSCLAEQAKLLYAEAEENNLAVKVKNQRFQRWHTCSLCEQMYHGRGGRARVGVLEDAVNRPEADELGLGDGGAWERFIFRTLPRGCVVRPRGRVGSAAAAWLRLKSGILAVQNNIASTYGTLGRHEEPYLCSETHTPDD